MPPFQIWIPFDLPDILYSTTRTPWVTRTAPKEAARATDPTFSYVAAPGPLGNGGVDFMPNGYIIRMREDDMMKKYDVIVIGTGSGNIILEEALKIGRASCRERV